MKCVFFSISLAVTSAASADVLYNVVNLENYFDGLATYSSIATGINDLGQVSGGYITSDLTRISAFTYSPGGAVTFFGGDNTTVFGINHSGQVAGYNFSTAFRYTPGVGSVPLGTFGGTDSLAYGINNSGQVAGTADLPDGSRHAFRYTDGIGLQDLGSLFGGSSRAWDVNNNGWVTGQSDGFNAFLYRDGIGMTYLGPGAGRAINDAGVVVGETGNGSNLATMYRDGNTIYLGDLGGASSEARDINSLNVVVGTSLNGDNRMRAFFWSENTGMRDLNDLIDPNSGWTLSQAFAINDSGQIVGEGFLDGKQYAVLLNPVPEPSTWALLLVGGGVFWYFRRRFK
jgi:probable HAF family extracellular repeat protein